MPARRLSERTLEFNFVAEFLEGLRAQHPKAFVYGYTTRHEARHGLDLSIGIPGRVLVAFQFKAPRRTSGSVYWFTIGDRGRVRGCANPRCSGIRVNDRVVAHPCCTQHLALILTALAISRVTGDPRPPIYYAFPLVASLGELQRHVPKILERTVLANVLDFPLVCESRKVEIGYNVGTPPWGSSTLGPHNTYIRVHSKPRTLPGDRILTAEGLLDQLTKKTEFPKIPPELPLTPRDLIEQAEKVLEDAESLEMLRKTLEDPDLRIRYNNNTLILLPE